VLLGGVALAGMAAAIATILLGDRPTAAEPHNWVVFVLAPSSDRVPATGAEGCADGPVARSQSAELVALDLDDNAAGPVVLSRGLTTAWAPACSLDGKRVYFAGKPRAESNWQIYAAELRDTRPRQVTDEPWDCLDPCPLPDGRIAFTQAVTEEEQYVAACAPDGGNPHRLTYAPRAARSTVCTPDGALLYAAGPLVPSAGAWQFLTVEPDGTECRRFGEGPPAGLTRSSLTLADDIFYFVACDRAAPSVGRLTAVDYATPWGSADRLDIPGVAACQGVTSLSDGSLVVSARGRTGTFELLAIDPGEPSATPRTIWRDNNRDALCPAAVRRSSPALPAPSKLDASRETGLLWCVDVSIGWTGEGTPNSALIAEDAASGQVLGTAPIEADGSFFVEAPADQPLELQLLDALGDRAGAPCRGLWVRPGEQRGCVGCHEKPSIPPPNRAAMATASAPVPCLGEERLRHAD